MYFVLQVVEDRDLRAASQQRRGEAGVQQNIDAMVREHAREANLFKENACRPEARAHRAAHDMKPGTGRDHCVFCLPIQEDEVIVRRIDTKERPKQKPEVNFSAAHSAGNEEQSVNADAQGHCGIS